MLRKPHFIILAVVTAGALVLIALPQQARSRIRVAFTSLVLPLFGLAGTAHAVAERAGAALTPRSALAARVEALERENERLRLDLVEAEIAGREAGRLREMLGYAQRVRWRLQPARVIGRDPANWWRSVHIDVGSRQGVTSNLAVLTPEGLVGRVAESGAWTSRVVLVGDPNCPVAVALLDGGDTGIVRGAFGGGFDGGLVEVSYLSRNALARPGQRVVTSGQGGVFPRGISVGEVVDSRGVGDGIYIEARVRLAANLGALDRVWVKLP